MKIVILFVLVFLTGLHCKRIEKEDPIRTTQQFIQFIEQKPMDARSRQALWDLLDSKTQQIYADSASKASKEGLKKSPLAMIPVEQWRLKIQPKAIKMIQGTATVELILKENQKERLELVWEGDKWRISLKKAEKVPKNETGVEE